MPSLSKTGFLDARQCELRLWYQERAPQLASPLGSVSEMGLAIGRRVGMLARERFPGGVAVDHDSGNATAVAATRALLDDPSVPAVFEAAFEHKQVRVRSDVLARGRDGGWELVEVKSGTRCKDLHVLDVAVQLWVLRGVGVELDRAGVLTLDRDYVWPGGELDVGALFALHDCTERATEMLSEIGSEVTRLQRVLKAREAPAIDPGPQCTVPYRCPFLEHCNRELAEPEWPLSALPALSAKRRDALEEMGIDDIRDIPDDFELSVLQSVARDAVLAGEEVIHGDLARALASVRYPVHHLDFESVVPAVPRFPGTRAYEQVPFQFSVRTERQDGSVTHSEFLHAHDSDPREPLARALLETLGEQGSIVVYSTFEKSVLTALREAVPTMQVELDALVGRLWDLHAVVRNNYYHPDFRGSFSMKSVLPALVADLGYGDLEIADGEHAALSYERALECEDDQRERIFAALRAYCARDTEGLMRIRASLRERVLARDQDD